MRYLDMICALHSRNAIRNLRLHSPSRINWRNSIYSSILGVDGGFEISHWVPRVWRVFSTWWRHHEIKLRCNSCDNWPLFVGGPQRLPTFDHQRIRSTAQGRWEHRVSNGVRSWTGSRHSFSCHFRFRTCCLRLSNFYLSALFSCVMSKAEGKDQAVRLGISYFWYWFMLELGLPLVWGVVICITANDLWPVFRPVVLWKQNV